MGRGRSRKKGTISPRNYPWTDEARVTPANSAASCHSLGGHGGRESRMKMEKEGREGGKGRGKGERRRMKFDEERREGRNSRR